MRTKIALLITAALSLLLMSGVTASTASAAPVKAAAQVTGFNAGPEPVASGDLLSIAGHLDRKPSATWVPYPGVTVTIQRKLTGGTYTAYKTLTTDTRGDFRTQVTATQSASYRAVFARNTTTNPVTGAGDNVAVAPTAITATTKVTGWPDSSTSGPDWAQDAFTRTLKVTRGPVVGGAGACGGHLTGCYRYTFTVTDSGSFKSYLNAPRPNGGGDLAGVIRGSFDGGLTGHFDANTRYLAAGTVPATEDGTDGKVASSGEWGTLALPAGVPFYDAVTDDYSWSYVATAPETCETFSQAIDGNTGNITGINHCTE